MARVTLTQKLAAAQQLIADLQAQLATQQIPAAKPAAVIAEYPRFVESYPHTQAALTAAVARNKAGLHCKVRGRSLYALDPRTYERLVS